MPLYDHASRSQLWRRTWSPDGSDATDETEPDTEYDSSDASEADSDFDDEREDEQVRSQHMQSASRAPESPTTFSIGQTVWINLKEVWYIGQVKRIVIDDSSKGVRLCPLYQVYFRNRNSTANMRATLDPLLGKIKPDTAQFRAWLFSQQCAIGSKYEL